jgi:hypothetical protein
MRIGKFQITGGPNWQFYAVTAFFVYASFSSGSPWPILGWIAFCVLLVPLCLWIHRWNERENQKMLAEFSDDPYIQAKYGPKRPG